MKFMKLGSRPDSFQADGKHSRYVATELASDVTVNVGDIKFYLHKFPLLSKSARLQKLVADTIDGNNEEIDIPNIPGGADSFEICAKFCYGMMVTLNPYNVASIRCAAEYLEMDETVEKGNLIYKIEVFLNSSILRAWKDSIIVLQSTKSLFPWSEDLKIVGRCIESISSKASMDTSKVEWSYTYHRESVSSEDGNEPQWQGVTKQQSVPIDWWIHDISELQISYYKRVMTAIKAKGMVSNVILGEALNAYASKRLPSLYKSIFQGVDNGKAQAFIETIIGLLPSESGVVPCNLLLKLLKASILLDCGENGKNKLIKKIGQQLQDAACALDLLIPAPVGGNMMYNVDIVICILKEFLAHDHHVHIRQSVADLLQEPKSPVHEASQAEIMVARLIDEYLAEIAVDPALPLSTFVNLAQMFRSTSRSCHDRLYRAIDMYLKEHAHLNKSDKKKICKLMDCKKLSIDACTHAVQNERLPLRIVVQILFVQQMKANLPNGIHALIMQDGGSRESSTTATTNTDDWYNGPLTGDINLLKADFNAEKLSVVNNEKKSLPYKNQEQSMERSYIFQKNV